MLSPTLRQRLVGLLVTLIGVGIFILVNQNMEGIEANQDLPKYWFVLWFFPNVTLIFVGIAFLIGGWKDSP